MFKIDSGTILRSCCGDRITIDKLGNARIWIGRRLVGMAKSHAWVRITAERAPDIDEVA